MRASFYGQIAIFRSKKELAALLDGQGDKK
jgi:hypothetical protein